MLLVVLAFPDGESPDKVGAEGAVGWDGVVGVALDALSVVGLASVGDGESCGGAAASSTDFAAADLCCRP